MGFGPRGRCSLLISRRCPALGATVSTAARSCLHHPSPSASPAKTGAGAGFRVLCRPLLRWEVGEVLRGLLACSWGRAGLGCSGQWYLKSQIPLELLLLFSLFLSPFCAPPPEKALCGFCSPNFSLFPREILSLSNPAAPIPTSGSHRPRSPPPLVPALTFAQSFELVLCQGGNDGFRGWGAGGLVWL